MNTADLRSPSIPCSALDEYIRIITPTPEDERRAEERDIALKAWSAQRRHTMSQKERDRLKKTIVNNHLNAKYKRLSHPSYHNSIKCNVMSLHASLKDTMLIKDNQSNFLTPIKRKGANIDIRKKHKELFLAVFDKFPTSMLLKRLVAVYDNIHDTEAAVRELNRIYTNNPSHLKHPIMQVQPNIRFSFATPIEMMPVYVDGTLQRCQTQVRCYVYGEQNDIHYMKLQLIVAGCLSLTTTAYISHEQNNRPCYRYHTHVIGSKIDQMLGFVFYYLESKISIPH